MKRIAIIPIRSGSKGLKNKNILPLNGKPLVAYSIEAALKSKEFDTVFVSTDSAEYAEIAKKYGADVSFLRSPETSSDTAGSWDVVREVLEEFKNRGETYDEIMLLQATSPLRNADDIKEAVKLFYDKKADSVQSVCEMDHSPLWSNTLPEDHSMDNFAIDPYDDMPRQKLPKYYRLNGAIYLLKVEELNKEKMFRHKCYAYVMPAERSVDIDTEFDFRIAELYLGDKQ